MANTSDPAAIPGPSTVPEAALGLEAPSLGWVPKVGIGAWTFVGFVVATAIVVAALAAVSEIVLPLTFAAVLAVVFQPLVEKLERRNLKDTYAAGLIVVGLLALMIVVLVATVRGVTSRATRSVPRSTLRSPRSATLDSSVDQASLDSARESIESAGPTIGSGFVTEIVSGFDKAVGLASGLILGALIMYYLLKDGAQLRSSVIARPSLGSVNRSTTSSATHARSCATTGAVAR